MRSVLKASRQTMKVSVPSSVIVLNCICICLMVVCETKVQSFIPGYIRMQTLNPGQECLVLGSNYTFFQNSNC